MVSGSNEAFNARHRTLLLRDQFRGVDSRPGENVQGPRQFPEIVMTTLGGRQGNRAGLTAIS
jgi:hypothetical protein